MIKSLLVLSALPLISPVGANAIVRGHAVLSLTEKPAALSEARSQGASAVRAATDSVTVAVAEGVEMSFRLSGRSAELRSAVTQLPSLEIPDTVSYGGTRYAVKYLGSYQGNGYRLDLSRCPALRSMTIPATVENIRSLGDAPLLRELHVRSLNPPYLSTDDAYRTLDVYVPQAALAAYEGNSSWNRASVWAEGHVPGTYSVSVETPGALGQQLLEMLADNDWSKVNELAVTGALNAEDLAIMAYMNRLTRLDLSGASFAALPDGFLFDKAYVREVLLPASASSIGSNAFSGCYRLQTVGMPGVTVMGYSAFSDCASLDSLSLAEGMADLPDGAFDGCTSLRSVKLPSTMKTIGNSALDGCSRLATVELDEALSEIGSSAFRNCDSLVNVRMNASLETIGYAAFYGCTRLAAVSLNEGLTTIGDNVFYGCTSLDSIALPSSLRNIGGYVFGQCAALKTVVCKAVLPPASTMALTDIDMTGRTLFVPSLSVNKYRLTANWNAFLVIKPFTGNVERIDLNQSFTIADAGSLAGSPALSLYYDGSDKRGQLTVEGDGVLQLGSFTMSHYMGSYNKSNYYFTTLVNSATIRSASVATKIDFYTNSWHFISFPYDVKVSDIEVPDNTFWVIRKYSGENRASGNGATWIDMTNDSTLRAYEGYILQLSNNLASSVGLTFPAAAGSDFSGIYAGSDVNVPLAEYVSEFAHNRSWNLVGNPYPCYYDTRELTFEAPITVWNGNGYTAYSPQDDSYILAPQEAFFVQRPADDRVVGFTAAGRQHAPTAAAKAGKRMRLYGGESERRIFNITLQGSGYADRARLVLNSLASADYETDKDASKFMSSNLLVPQIFFNEGGVRYAINERPAGDGSATLGLYAGQAGEYILRLETAPGESVELSDKKAGKTVCLGNGQEYAFFASAGTDEARFVLKVADRPVTGIATATPDVVQVTTMNGHIRVAAPAKAQITVATSAGRLLYSGMAAHANVAAPAGIYFVRVGGQAYKVQVKE